MKKKKHFLAGKFILSVLVALACVMSGCSPVVPEEIMETPAPQPSNQFSSTGTMDAITIAIPEGKLGSNPLTERSRSMGSFYRLIYESLIGLDDKGAYVGILAQSWSFNTEEDTLTLMLRKGVKWQDGRDFTAQDVVHTLNLIKDAGNDSIYYNLMEYLQSWESDADGNVVIKLSQCFYGVLSALVFPVVPFGVQLGDISVTTAGTGPYKIADASDPKKIRLDANANWWKKAPAIQTIFAQVTPDNDASLASLGIRQIDALQTSSLTTEQYRVAGAANAYEYTTQFYEFLAPNIAKGGILSQKNVRQAIAYAINRREIVSNVYINHAVLADTPVSPGSFLYQGKLLTYAHNTQKAKELLEAALGKNWVYYGEPLQLLTHQSLDDNLRLETANLIAQYLALVGIPVEVKALEWDAFVTEAAKKEYDLLLGGWYLTPVPDLSFAFESGAKENWSGYSSTEMDNLLALLLEQGTEKGMVNVAEQIQQQFLDDVPFISLYFRTHTLMTNNTLRGVGRVDEDNAYQTLPQWTFNR